MAAILSRPQCVEKNITKYSIYGQPLSSPSTCWPPVRLLINTYFYLESLSIWGMLTARVIGCTHLQWWMADMFNTMRPRQNGRFFSNNMLKYISLNENIWVSINISLKFVSIGPINNILVLIQIMFWPQNQVTSHSWTNYGYNTGAFMRHSASMSWCTRKKKMCYVAWGRVF